MKKRSVSFELGIEFLNIIYVSFVLQNVRTEEMMNEYDAKGL
jgi:hypothetical protein